MKPGDVIEKTGLVLDRILMESPELTSNLLSNIYDSETKPDKIMIETNEDFQKQLKDINLLLYLKYPSVIELVQWKLNTDEINKITLLTRKTVCKKSLSDILHSLSQ